MTDKQVVEQMLKMKKSTSKMILDISNCVDPKSKDYNKKYLTMMLPISNDLYYKIIKDKYHLTTYRNE